MEKIVKEFEGMFPELTKVDRYKFFEFISQRIMNGDVTLIMDNGPHWPIPCVSYTTKEGGYYVGIMYSSDLYNIVFNEFMINLEYGKR